MSRTGTPATRSTSPGSCRFDETIAGDDAVFTALARFVLGHDLVNTVVFKKVPPHHPLRWRLADFRAGEVSGAMDWLCVRLRDIPRALTARSWFTDGELVLDVEDPFLDGHGRYPLTIRDSKADCAPTDREPDLSLDVRDLGSVCLGGTAPSTLVRAGHIRAHHPDAGSLADALFRTDRSRTGSDRACHCSQVADAILERSAVSFRSRANSGGRPRFRATPSRLRREPRCRSRSSSPSTSPSFPSPGTEARFTVRPEFLPPHRFPATVPGALHASDP